MLNALPLVFVLIGLVLYTVLAGEIGRAHV